MTIKAALLIIKHLLIKSLLKKFTIWKFQCPKKRTRTFSKIPIPKQVKDSQSRDRSRPESPNFRVLKSEPSTSRPISAPPKRQKKEDVGSRLHNKAQEIEEKKEKIRKKLKVDYSFRPTLAEHTNRWLNRSSREARESHEEIAVVSSAAILNFNKNSSGAKPFIMNRADFKYVSVEIKENMLK